MRRNDGDTLYPTTLEPVDASNVDEARLVRTPDTLVDTERSDTSPRTVDSVETTSASGSGWSPNHHRDSQSSASSNDVESPRSPSFASSPHSAEGILRSFSPRPVPSRKPSLKKSTSQSTTQPLSPGRLPLRPPTPPVISLKVKITDESDDSTLVSDPSPCDRSRTVRFKPRVRISSGVHHTHDELPTISHASSFSDSSSISAPLRPPAEEHVRPQPRARSEEQKPLDGTFTADDFSAWLARSGMDDSSNVPSKGPIEAWNDDSADETTALMAHRRRRRALEGKGQQKKGPPNYIVANGGLPRSPVPSPTAGKQMQGGYGTLPQLEEEEDENESDTVSRASSKAEDSLINGAWSAGWSGGWQSTQSWWSKTRALFCCGSNTDRDDHFEN